MSITGVFGSAAAAGATQGVTVLGSGAGTAGTVVTVTGSAGFINVVQACFVPANTLRNGAYLQVNFELSSSISAGSINAFYATFAGVTCGPALTYQSISTAGQIKSQFNIRYLNASQVQVSSPMNQMGAFTAQALQVVKADPTIDQMVQFCWLGNPNTNGVGLKAWSVEAYTSTATATFAGLVPGKKCFYGMNTHNFIGASQANYVSAMKALKLNTLRIDWYGRGAIINSNDNTQWIKDMASAMQADGTGLQLDVLCVVSPNSASGTYATELAAYNVWFDQGSYIAAQTIGLGVTLYEMANELDSLSQIRPLIDAVQGTVIQDFTATGAGTWNAMRGAMRGVYDGIKSVHPNAKVGSNAFTNASIWASDALWNGVDVTGATGNNVVRWDWTNWHMYEGDARSLAYSGGQTSPVNFDLLMYLKNAYGKPIMMTEWNANLGDATSASIETRQTAWLTSWYSAQDTCNLAGIMYYDWVSYRPFAVSLGALTTLYSWGQAFVDFISAHPALK